MRTRRMVKTTLAALSLGLLAAPTFAVAQYNQAPQYSQTPQYNQAPQYSQTPQYNQEAPQYDPNGQNGQAAPSNQQPLPGTLNYLEGVAYLDGQQLTQQSVGSVAMQAGEELRTSEGRVEILLNPGVYLRVGHNSAVKMLSPELTPTVVELEHGHAGVEVDQLFRENTLQVIDNGVTTQMVKTGYYEFNANSPMARVFKGQAEVEYQHRQWQEVKGLHQMALFPGEHAKTRKFTPDLAEDQLLAWSKLRSENLAEANNQIASEYYGAGYAPGWYPDPWYPGFTYLGMNPFYSPFGWGFYPMGWGMGMGMGMGMGWGGWGSGFYGRGFYGRPGFYGRGGMNGGMRSIGNGRFQGGGMRGGGGGFHGGGGGFHGGGGGGGRR